MSHGQRHITRLVLCLAAILLASLASAVWPIVLNPTASLDVKIIGTNLNPATQYTITCNAYDPVRKKSVSSSPFVYVDPRGELPNFSYYTPIGPYSQNGIVYWYLNHHYNGSYGTDVLVLATYDVYKGAWQTMTVDRSSERSSSYVNFDDLSTSAGVASWSVYVYPYAGNSTRTQVGVYAATYDPRTGWTFSSQLFGGDTYHSHTEFSGSYVNSGGIVAFDVDSRDQFGTLISKAYWFGLYDPAAGRWAWNTYNVPVNADWSGVKISHATVGFTVGTKSLQFGYAGTKAGWVAGVAKSLPYVYEAPVSGKAPLTTLFTDFSIGEDSFTWVFGDGQQDSVNHSTVHIYTSPGTFTPTLTTTLPSGSASATAGVVTVTK